MVLLGKPRGWKKGQLEPFREEVLRLRADGYSYVQITEWLAEKGVVVNQGTVSRFCSKQK